MVRPHGDVDKSALAGAVSGSISRFLCQPLDVIKIRFQLQVEPIQSLFKKELQPKGKYVSILQCIGCMIKEEGVLSLWKGLIPAQLLSVTYGLAQFSTFKYVTITPGNNPLYTFIAGGVAGSAATLVSFPFDVIRTRLVAQGEPKLYHNLFSAFTHMMSSGGYKTLYQGLLTTLLQNSVQTGLQFSSYYAYEYFIGTYVDPGHHLHSLKHGLSGSLAGFTAKLVTYPFDVCKKRLQVQGFEKPRLSFGRVVTYNGLLQCIEKIFKIEGIGGFYKGLSPSLIKAAATTGTTFYFYELILDFVK